MITRQQIITFAASPGAAGRRGAKPASKAGAVTAGVRVVLRKKTTSRLWAERVKKAYEGTKRAAATATREGVDRAFAMLHGRAKAEIKLAAEQLSSGAIRPAAFEWQMQMALRNAYDEAFALGKAKATGAWAELSTPDLAAARQMYRQERVFLRGFLADIRGKYKDLSPELRSARIAWRAQMYADALVGVANRGFVLSSPPGQMVRWVMSEAEHCETCIEEAGRGWRPMNDLTRIPGDGSTACVTNCKCFLECKDGLTGIPPVEPSVMEEPDGGGVE